MTTSGTVNCEVFKRRVLRCNLLCVLISGSTNTCHCLLSQVSVSIAVAPNLCTYLLYDSIEEPWQSSQLCTEHAENVSAQ
jgi:hypothetical protein